MPLDYSIFQKEDFKENLEWIREKVDPTLASRIEKTIISKLKVEPYRTTGRIRTESKKPLRYIKIGKRRLFFIICEECRHENYSGRWNCPNCNTTSSNSIILFDIEKRESAYAWD